MDKEVRDRLRTVFNYDEDMINKIEKYFWKELNDLPEPNKLFFISIYVTCIDLFKGLNNKYPSFWEDFFS